jgi:hypothetical protein
MQTGWSAYYRCRSAYYAAPVSISRRQSAYHRSTLYREQYWTMRSIHGQLPNTNVSQYRGVSWCLQIVAGANGRLAMAVWLSADYSGGMGRPVEIPASLQ